MDSPISSKTVVNCAAVAGRYNVVKYQQSGVSTPHTMGEQGERSFINRLPYYHSAVGVVWHQTWGMMLLIPLMFGLGKILINHFIRGKYMPNL